MSEVFANRYQRGLSKRTILRGALIRILSSVLLLMTAAGCAASNTTASEPRNRLIYGLTLEPSGFDPHLNASSELGIPLRQVYDTLVYRNPADGQFVAGLASEWQISPDGLVYTFRLKEGVTFHDGTPFNAQAVAANLDRIMAVENGSQKARFMLGSYSGYQILDDYTIQLLLSEPYSPLLDSLSQVYLGIASPTALGAYSNERYQFHQVGTGPFRFVEYIPGDRLVIRRSENYTWGPSFYNAPNERSVDEVVFRFFTDPPTRSIALEAGDTQVVGEILPADARAIATNTEITMIPVAVPGQPLQFMMNTRRYPTDNITVRQALLFGTNREAIIDSLFQRYSPVAWGPLAATTQFYNRQVVGAYAYDPSQARTMLEGAGFVDADNNGYYDGIDGDLTITMIVPGWGFIPEVAQLIQDQWRDIGVRAAISPTPTRTLVVEAVNQGEYNLVAFYTFGIDPSFLSDYFATNGSMNWTGFSSTELDGLLLEAVRQTDPNARASAYATVQRIIMEQALILPIRDYVNLNGVRNGVEGLVYDPYGWFPLLANVTLSAP